MGGRYLVSGVQLGMLLAIAEKNARDKIINKIIEDQCIGNSDKDIKKDAETLRVENLIGEKFF